MRNSQSLYLISGVISAFIGVSILACGGGDDNNTNNGSSGDELPARSRGVLCGDGPGAGSCYASETCEAHSDGYSYCFCPVGTVPGSGSRCVAEGGGGNENALICSQLGDDFCAGKGACVDLEQADCDYHTERMMTPPAECAQVADSGRPVGLCISSVADPSNANPDAAFCEFTQHWSNPTSLTTDCRCTQVASISTCKRAASLNASVAFGDGPRFRDVEQVDQLGAFQDGREMFIATSWSSSASPKQGALLAVNIDTGDRRVVSGSFKDPVNGSTTTGDGPAFGVVTHAIKGNDGYYVASVDETGEEASLPIIFKVDPDTGNREIVYNANEPDNFAVCSNGAPEDTPGKKTVQIQGGNRWTMDADGNHYFAPFGAAPGPSIVRVSKDGQSCDYVVRIADGPVTFEPANVGTGYTDIQFDFENLFILDDKLYARSDKLMLEVTMPASGEASLKMFSNAANGSVGGGCEGDIKCMGRVWTIWDPYREVFWTSGSPSDDNIIVAIDPTNGDRIDFPCWHPEQGRLASCAGNGAPLAGPMGRGGIIIDEQEPHDLFLAHDNEAVIRFDLKTLNHNIISR